MFQRNQNLYYGEVVVDADESLPIRQVSFDMGQSSDTQTPENTNHEIGILNDKAEHSMQIQNDNELKKYSLQQFHKKIKRGSIEPKKHKDIKCPVEIKQYFD
jgi:hypothetical protein